MDGKFTSSFFHCMMTNTGKVCEHGTSDSILTHLNNAFDRTEQFQGLI